MDTEQLIERGRAGHVVGRCSTVQEANDLVATTIDEGADAADLVMVAHAPHPIDLDLAPPSWWRTACIGALVGLVVAAVAATWLAGALLGAAAALVLGALLPRGRRTKRALVAREYDIVATR